MAPKQLGAFSPEFYPLAGMVKNVGFAVKVVACVNVELFQNRLFEPGTVI